MSRRPKGNTMTEPEHRLLARARAEVAQMPAALARGTALTTRVVCLDCDGRSDLPHTVHGLRCGCGSRAINRVGVLDVPVRRAS